MGSRRRNDENQRLSIAPGSAPRIKTHTPRVREANAFARDLLKVPLTKVDDRFPEASIVSAGLLCSSHFGDDTLDEYARYIAYWWTWCIEHGKDPLEPNPAVVALWVSEMLRRYVWKTIRLRLVPIRLLFRVQRGVDLYDTKTRRWSGPLHNIIMSARRDPKTNPSAPLKPRVDIDRVKRLLSVRLSPVADVRNAALITLGFGGGLPAAVLRHMRFEWIEERGDLLYVHHDSRAYPSPFVVSPGGHDQTCPVRNYQRWSSLRRRLTGQQDGYVFTRIMQNDEITTETSLSHTGVGAILLVLSVAAGIEPPARATDMRATAVRELGKLNLSDTRFLLEAGAVSPSTAARYNRAKHAVEYRKELAARRSSRGRSGY